MTLSKTERDALLATLKTRFERNVQRHPDIAWRDVLARLEDNPDKLKALHAMEESEGEPDVVVLNDKDDAIVFVDCSAESPKGRRSICYDPQALEDRKENKPKHSAVGMAEEMGITLLTEQEYVALQKRGKFDLKSSNWVETPEEVRELGGAIFGDRRYNRVFIYHNGADSYYAARGFRGKLGV